MRILTIASICFLFTQCQLVKGNRSEFKYTKCTVYSYYHLFDELTESERYEEEFMVYNSDGKISTKGSLAKGGDTIRVSKYYYNGQGLVDSLVHNDKSQGEKLREEFSYDSLRRVTTIMEVWRGNRYPKEMNFYNDGKHTAKHFLGGSHSNNTEYLYNEHALLKKIVHYSPEGEYWGEIQYVYDENQNRIEVTSIGSKGNITDVTRFSYNKAGMLEWETIEDTRGKIFVKLKYEYE